MVTQQYSLKNICIHLTQGILRMEAATVHRGHCDNASSTVPTDMEEALQAHPNSSVHTGVSFHKVQKQLLLLESEPTGSGPDRARTGPGAACCLQPRHCCHGAGWGSPQSCKQLRSPLSTHAPPHQSLQPCEQSISGAVSPYSPPPPKWR